MTGAAEVNGHSDGEIIRSAAEAVAQFAPLDAVTNAVRTKAEGDAPAETFALSMRQILDRLKKQTGGWPRRVNSMLFIDDPDHGLCVLEKQAALFGWLHSAVGAVQWSRGSDCVTRDDFFAELRRVAQPYRAIEQFPHFPPLDQHYYGCGEIRPGDGNALRELIGRFTPATDVDADLIEAAFVTPGWGGPPGARPGFAITSDHGRGSGKTALLKSIGRLWGGCFDLSLADDENKVKSRLLTPAAATTRIIGLDNIKSNHASCASAEALITCSEISGHRLFHGEGKRPNTLTWLLTVNGPSMGRDLAQRCVFIKLGKPAHCPTWEEETIGYINENRDRLFSDVAAFYVRPAVVLETCSRWGAWERSVLARLAEPSEAAALILARARRS